MPFTDPKPDETAADLQESQESLERKRLALEQSRKRNKEMKAAQLVKAWESFVEEEARELEARRNGQLAKLLGEPLPGEPPEALRQLAREDQRQAEEGLVTLANGTATIYKHIDELTQEDMPARSAAQTMRTTWLKERRDGWLANNRGSFSS
jgi:hypothetical protein